MNFDDEVEKAINNNMESEEEIAYEYQENEELEQEQALLHKKRKKSNRITN